MDSGFFAQCYVHVKHNHKRNALQKLDSSYLPGPICNELGVPMPMLTASLDNEALLK